MLPSRVWCAYHSMKRISAVSSLLLNDLIQGRLHRIQHQLSSAKPVLYRCHVSNGYVTSSTLMTSQSDVLEVRNPQEQEPETSHSSCAAERIKSLSPAEERQLKCLKLEYEILIDEGVSLPQMTDEQWLTLLDNCENIYQRYSYYSEWHKRDQRNTRRMKPKKKREEKTSSFEPEQRNNDRYKQIMFGTDLYKQDRVCFNNLAHAMIFGDKLVVDLSFGPLMKRNVLRKLDHQLSLLLKYNKYHRDPFHLILTGCKPDEYLPQRVAMLAANDACKQVGVTISEDHYLDLFPREKLVYLSPNARDVLHEYNSDDVYIIGGHVDNQQQEPLTISKARHEGIRSARLPMDQYLKWKGKDKSFNIDQMMAIMLEIKDSRDWKKAFHNIPDGDRKVYIL